MGRKMTSELSTDHPFAVIERTLMVASGDNLSHASCAFPYTCPKLRTCPYRRNYLPYLQPMRGPIERRPLSIRFIAQKSVNPFPLDFSRPLGIEKIRDSQLHPRGLEDIRVE